MVTKPRARKTYLKEFNSGGKETSSLISGSIEKKKYAINIPATNDKRILSLMNADKRKRTPKTKERPATTISSGAIFFTVLEVCMI